MKITFWEKPGCMGNARQKALLAAGGHEIDARSLPGHRWTKEELAAFLAPLPVPEWFNRGARRIKDGDVDPDAVGPDEAMSILVSDPILVRRPLLSIGNERHVGFDLDWIEARIGPLPATERIQRVRSQDLTSCPGDATGVRCGDARD